MSAETTLQRYFVENRSRLIDIAAYLDRIERSANLPSVAGDFRLEAFKKALEVLLSPSGNRVERIQEILSDPTTEPTESSEGVKSAFGAFQHRAKSDCC